MEKAYQKFLGPSKGDVNSKIYRPFCGAVERLSKIKADEKIIILMSDLVEYSSDGNLYKPRSVKEDADGLEKACPFPKITGLRVIIIYNPRTQKNPVKAEREFNVALKVWTEVLTRNGITPEVKGNLERQ